MKAVETAIRATRWVEGTVQTPNRKGGESHSGYADLKSGFRKEFPVRIRIWGFSSKEGFMTFNLFYADDDFSQAEDNTISVVLD